MDSTTFKAVMSQWTSGVTVVTTIHDGHWKGTTASSFTSVSAEPPLVLVCLNRKSYTHELICATGVFAINILGHDQAEIGKLFAGMYPEIEDRFAGKNCITAISGSPILADSLGWFDCKLRASYVEGDHTIFVGEVLAGGKSEEGEPLLYHKRQWGQFARLK